MKQIKSIHLTRLLVGAHFQFHNMVVEFIKTGGASDLHVGDFFPEYEEAVQLEFNGLNKPFRLANTENIRRNDTIRDFYLRRFQKTVKDYCRSPIAEERMEALDFWSRVSPFEGIFGNEMNKETALVTRFLDEMDTEKNKAYLEKIELAGTVGKIKVYNLQFIEEMEKRITAEAQRVPFNIRENQKLINEYYHAIVQRVNAYAVVSPTEKLDEFIDLMNAHIDEFKRIISHMRPGGSGNERLENRGEEKMC